MPDKQGRLVYSYFNVTDAVLASDHKWPAATATAYEYFEYKGWAVHSAKELKDRIAKALAARETEISFKATYEGDEIADMKAALGTSSVLSGYSYTYSGRAYTLTIRYR